MHAVNRGPEPQDLKPIRDELTPRWVAYYHDGEGEKPKDSKWRDFHPRLSEVFLGLRAYCEVECKGEVEHFRPKSTYPAKVYEWTNWVLACHVCNNKKGGRWPTGGYVDPCAKTTPAQPEAFFELDTVIGEILVRSGLSAARRRKADNMIKDLGLNAYHQRKRRMRHLRLVSKALEGRPDDDPVRLNLIDLVASRECPLSSFTRAWLREQDYPFDST